MSSSSISRRHALKIMGGGVLGGAAMAVGFNGATAQSEKSQRGPTGGPGSWSHAFTGVDQNGAEFTGVMEITRFSNKGGLLTASGNIYQGEAFVDRFDAEVTEAWVDPAPVTAESQVMASAGGSQVSDVAVMQGSGECQVLNLVLGPLYLNVLGLVIEIPNPIVLDISADPDLGILGDLLCAINDLLNGGSPLNQIVGLLNQILGILQGLGL
jgi:hypothetical protein